MDHRVNHSIKARTVSVIGEEGQKLGEMTLSNAIYKADEAGLDLVEVDGRSTPPVCKIMDYGKFKFQQKQKQKNKTTAPDRKELRFRPTTGDGDVKVKINQIVDFLKNGHEVLLSVMFKGREIAIQIPAARRLLSIITDDPNVTSLVKSTNDTPRLDGKRLTVSLLPK